MKSTGFQVFRGDIPLVVTAIASIFDQSTTIKNTIQEDRRGMVGFSGRINYSLKIVKPQITVLVETQEGETIRVLTTVETPPISLIDTQYLCDHYAKEFSTLLERQVSLVGGISVTKFKIVRDATHAQQKRNKFLLLAIGCGLIPLSQAIGVTALIVFVFMLTFYGLWSFREH